MKTTYIGSFIYNTQSLLHTIKGCTLIFRTFDPCKTELPGYNIHLSQPAIKFAKILIDYEAF